MEKHSVSRLSYLFSHLHLLSSYSFSSDLLSSNLPLLSASALLCFSSGHIVGSLTSKLPSIIDSYSGSFPRSLLSTSMLKDIISILYASKQCCLPPCLLQLQNPLFVAAFRMPSPAAMINGDGGTKDAVAASWQEILANNASDMLKSSDEPAALLETLQQMLTLDMRRRL